MLREDLINFEREPLGRYTREQSARGAGYLVLAHAAIEQYFEDMCRNILLASKKKFVEKSRVTYVLAFILNHSDTKPTPQQRPAVDVLRGRIVECIIAHERKITSNHGVTEGHLCALYFPIGFNFDAVDSMLLPEANTFGRYRGELAHKSIRTQVFDPIDGVQAVERMLRCITGANGFDLRMTQFARSHS